MPHYFDEEDTVVRSSRIPDLVDGFHGRIDGRIETDGKVRSVISFVDRARNSHYPYAGFFLQFQGTGKGTVAADDDQGIDPASRALRAAWRRT